MSAPIPPGARGFTGCKPSVFSPADHYMEPLAGASLTTLPASLDNRGWCSPVRNQGPTNSCTAFAWTEAAEYQRNKQHVGKAGYKPMVFSKWFQWARSRQREYGANAWTDNVGVSLREGMIVGANDGLCADNLWPEGLERQNIDPLSVGPEAEKARYSGQHHKLATVRAVQPTHAAFIAALAQGFGIVFGFSTNSGFWATPNFTDPPAQRGMIDPTALFLDGDAHAVFACGYRADGRIITQNSHGDNFGDGGYMYVPNSWFGSVIFEAWTVHALKE